jgi:hypothetical protein
MQDFKVILLLIYYFSLSLFKIKNYDIIIDRIKNIYEEDTL